MRDEREEEEEVVRSSGAPPDTIQLTYVELIGLYVLRASLSRNEKDSFSFLAQKMAPPNLLAGAIRFIHLLLTRDKYLSRERSIIYHHHHHIIISPTLRSIDLEEYQYHLSP